MRFPSHVHHPHKDRRWKQIWKLQVPQKIRLFLWLLYHEKILTNNERMRRGLTSNPYCHHYIDKVGDLDHLFRHCETPKTIWANVNDEVRRKGAETPSFKDWLGWNLDVNTTSDHEPWKDRFSIYLWLIWKWRTDEIFNNNRILLHIKVSIASSYYHEVRSTLTNETIAYIELRKTMVAWVGWCRPPPGCLKLNTDDCQHEGHGFAGVGVVLRDV